MVCTNAWRCFALLVFAMVAPVGLPAGAGDPRRLEVRRRQAGEPLLSIDPTLLQSFPDCNAPSLIQLQADQPMVVLRRWESTEGQRWLRVQAANQRGWLPI